MNIEANRIRNYRLRAHHLDKKIPADGWVEAAGACGLQNSPPGAWETAMHNRLQECTLSLLKNALYNEKSLLQAWSFRGAPVIFPTAQSYIFLTPLAALDGEEPWIYTRGITAALNYIQLPFNDLLLRVKKAVKYLDSHRIKSKELLDETLADIIEKELPENTKTLWRGPSMYGNPEKQTVGEAAVSFLLRPCSYESLVVFGERQGVSPAFTSYKNWTGTMPCSIPDGDKELVRKYLHCYGPATKGAFAGWLGCSRQQAERLWNTISDEMEQVCIGGNKCFMLMADMEELTHPEESRERMILLGAHDPYLDVKDRAVLLDDKLLQKDVWKTVENPGAVLKDGRIIGIWKTKTQKDSIDITIKLFENVSAYQQRTLGELAEKYALFREVRLKSCNMDNNKS